MGRRKNFQDASLQTKVLVPMILVLVVMLAVTVWFVDYRVSRQIWDDVRDSLSTDDVVFRTLQANHLNYLRLRFQSLVNEPKNRAAFGTLDFNTIQQQLAFMLEGEELLKQNPARNEKIVFLLFTPADPLANQPEPMIQPASAPPAFVAASTPNIQRGLQPEHDPSLNLVDTVAVNGRLYNLVSIPVYNLEKEQLGVLTVGEHLTWVTAQEYSGVTHQPMILLAEGKVVPTALAKTNPAQDRQYEALFAQLAGGQTENFAAVTVGQDNFLCRSGRFNSLASAPGLGYLLLSSYAPSSNVLKTQQLLVIVSLVAIIIGTLLVWLAVHKVTQPLRELRDSAEAVGRGDYSQRVAVHSQDECGQLAATFNQMTENVQSAQAQLQQTVTTLKTTQAQLVQSEKLSAVGEFVAGVAHELNNPLTVVMGFAEMLQFTEANPKQRKQLDLIFKAASRCKKIVQSLLSFARKHQPERRPVAVNKLIEDVLEIVAYQLRTSNVEVECQLAANLPLTLADGHQIQQVMLNLINNARQAIEAHQDAGRIIIGTDCANHFIRIRIQDSGPGIAPENLNRIFDPFFTTKQAGQGTGLGLSLCYGLIKEHGGHIHVTSQPGHGATFTIELPATEGTASALHPDDAEPGADPQEGRGQTILLVDDETVILEMLRDDLQRYGYTVLTANSGESALRELHQQQITIILSDIKMPGLNGRQLYDWLRASRPEFTQRILFMTGDIINESLRLFLAQEQLTCLNKPFALRELRQGIKTLLRATAGH